MCAGGMGQANAHSKRLGVAADDDMCGSIAYEDPLVRAIGGRSIPYRKAAARRALLGWPRQG